MSPPPCGSLAIPVLRTRWPMTGALFHPGIHLLQPGQSAQSGFRHSVLSSSDEFLKFTTNQVFFPLALPRINSLNYTWSTTTKTTHRFAIQVVSIQVQSSELISHSETTNNEETLINSFASAGV